MNLTKTTMYLKKCLLEEVTLEMDYPRINIDDKAFVYPQGITSKDEHLKRQVSGFLKEQGLRF